MVAIQRCHASIVRFLLERGANVHATLADGSTTLMMAATEATNRDIMRLLLLDTDVDIETRDNSQRTALQSTTPTCLQWTKMEIHHLMLPLNRFCNDHHRYR